MNHNIATNPAKRTEVYNLLKDKPWVTVDMRTNGQDFDSYLDNIYNHKFVICPEGNGIDTHRVWECLYMGTIPVVAKNEFTEQMYSFLPCAPLLNDLRLNEGILDFSFEVINTLKNSFITDNLLTFEYWKNKILSYKQ